MPKAISLLSLLFATALLSSCSQKEPPPEELLLRNWMFSEIVNAEGQEVKTIGEEDYMLLRRTSDGQVFNYELKLEGITAKGFWSFENDTLSYTYLPKDAVSKVDSITMINEDGESRLEYYKAGKKLAHSDSGIEPVLLTRKYYIPVLTDSSLVLQEKGISYKFNYRAEEISTVPSAGAILNGSIGIFGLLLLMFLISEKRSRINWRLVISGVLLQIIFALLVLKVPVVRSIFDGISGFFVQILAFTDAGTDFLFRSFVTNRLEVGLINFVIKILPTIIFFAAFSSLLYYWGILQKIVYAFAWAMKKLMRLSGAESLAAAGNIFLGQTESPLLVKPYIDRMTRSEVMALMSGGMATIAGGVLAAYIGFLGGEDPVQQQLFASHLLTASIMSAPASIVAAKMLVPEVEEFDSEMVVTKERIGTNVLEAISNGTTDGLRLAVNVGAMLLVFTALMAMINYICYDWIGSWTGLNEMIARNSGGKYDGLTMQYLLGQLFSPLSWLIGVRGDDISLVGQLLGEKTILNEFFAYVSLGDLKSSGKLTDQRSIIIATYALCGFANFASIGIQIGGIGAIAPKRKTLLSSLGLKALVAGTVACLMTAAVAGMLS